MPSAKRVLVLQHAEPEHPGRISDSLNNVGVACVTARPDKGEPLPQLDGFHGLIVMGGPQSVYEVEKFPFLQGEKKLINNSLDMGLPVLGICLGSQLLAEALGANVRPSGHLELGWREVVCSRELKQDPVLGVLPESITPLHWHGDIYDLPEGTVPVGSSALSPVQGFVLNEKCYGLLFHIEMTEQQIDSMIKIFPDDVVRGGMTPEILREESAERLREIESLSREVFLRWALRL